MNATTTDAATRRQRHIAAAYIHAHRTTTPTGLRGRRFLEHVADAITRDAVRSTLNGEHDDARAYHAAAQLVTDRATRLTLTTDQEDTMTTTLETPAATDVAAPIRYLVNASRDDEWACEDAMTYLEANTVKFVDSARTADVFEDLISGSHCREIGALTHAPDSGKWILVRFGTWSIEDHATAARVLRSFKRDGVAEDATYVTTEVSPNGHQYLRYGLVRPLADLSRDCCTDR